MLTAAPKSTSSNNSNQDELASRCPPVNRERQSILLAIVLHTLLVITVMPLPQKSIYNYEASPELTSLIKRNDPTAFMLRKAGVYDGLPETCRSTLLTSLTHESDTESATKRMFDDPQCLTELCDLDVSKLDEAISHQDPCDLPGQWPNQLLEYGLRDDIEPNEKLLALDAVMDYATRFSKRHDMNIGSGLQNDIPEARSWVSQTLAATKRNYWMGRINVSWLIAPLTLLAYMVD